MKILSFCLLFFIGLSCSATKKQTDKSPKQICTEFIDRAKSLAVNEGQSRLSSKTFTLDSIVINRNCFYGLKDTEVIAIFGEGRGREKIENKHFNFSYSISQGCKNDLVVCKQLFFFFNKNRILEKIDMVQ